MPNFLFSTNAPRATILIRLLVGAVFLSEGVQKFLFPAALGVGRFTKIGIPAPQFFAPFVGVVEIVCGTLLIVGLVTSVVCDRLAAGSSLWYVESIFVSFPFPRCSCYRVFRGLRRLFLNILFSGLHGGRK